MKRFMILITAIAAAYLSMPVAAYSQSDSDLVWIKENAYVGYVTHMDLSPDGSKVLISNYYKDISTIDGIYIYDVETGNLVDSIIGVGSIGGFSPDNMYIYTYLRDVKGVFVKKIDAVTHQVMNYSGQIDPGAPKGIGVLQDGRIVVSTALGNNLLYFLDGNTLVVLDSLQNDPYYCVGSSWMSLSPVGSLMALIQVCSKSFNIPPINIVDINIWDINTKTKQKKLPLKANDGQIYGMTFFPDGNRIAINKDYRVLIFDINTLDTLHIFNLFTHDILFSYDKSMFHYGTQNQGIKAVNANNYQEICTSNLVQGKIAGNAVFTKDEKYIIAADPANAVLMKVKNCAHNTSIPEDSNISSDTIFPNPGTDTFTLFSTKLIDKLYPYDIANNTGIIFKKDKIKITNGKGSFSVNGISQGSYFLRIIAPKEVFVYKFVIER